MRFVAEYREGVNTAIDAPTAEAADFAAFQYSAVNRTCGPVVAIRQPPAYLRVNETTGVVETLWVDGSYRPICPEGTTAPLPKSPEQRVIVLINEEAEIPAAVYKVPGDWDGDDIDRFVNERHAESWIGVGVTTVQEVEQA